MAVSVQEHTARRATEPPVRASDLCHEPGIMEVLCKAAPSLLDQVVKALPQLHGPATRNLSTALRAAPTREKLKGATLRGDPLLKILGWIAAADDARRHLTATLVH